MNRLCLNALQREYEKFMILQKPVIETLRQMASELHGNKQNVGRANVASSRQTDISTPVAIFY